MPGCKPAPQLQWGLAFGRLPLGAALSHGVLAVPHGFCNHPRSFLCGHLSRSEKDPDAFQILRKAPYRALSPYGVHSHRLINKPCHGTSSLLPLRTATCPPALPLPQLCCATQQIHRDNPLLIPLYLLCKPHAPSKFRAQKDQLCNMHMDF